MRLDIWTALAAPDGYPRTNAQLCQVIAQAAVEAGRLWRKVRLAATRRSR